MAKYFPQNHPPAELLKKLGFVSANRGFILQRAKLRVGRPIRIHALISLDGTIELHEDHQVGSAHVSSKSHPRLTRFAEMLWDIDEGRIPEASESMKNKYTGLRKALSSLDIKP